MKAPLVVLIMRLGTDGDTKPYADAVRATFTTTDTTLPQSSEVTQLLHITEIREFSPEKDAATGQDRVPAAVDTLVTSARSALFVVLDAESAGPENVTSPPKDFERSLLQKLDTARDTQGAIISVFLNHAGSLHLDTPGEPRLARFGLADLDERDLRLPFLTLHVFHHALQLLASANGRMRAKAVRLFFSHAKRDGVPLATAARDWMKRLKGFKAFYDTEDLDLDKDIDNQLSTAITEAVIIAFRTEIFDQRFWCQKEVLWAEKHRRPVITVDARWQLQHGPSVISFDSIPAVRVPDGSLVRILAATLREAVRIELFQARVDIHRLSIDSGGKMWAVVAVPRCPSLVSLHEACQSPVLTRIGPSRRAIVYPDPSLPEMLLQAARGLVSKAVAGCELHSLDEFRLLH